MRLRATITVLLALLMLGTALPVAAQEDEDERPAPEREERDDEERDEDEQEEREEGRRGGLRLLTRETATLTAGSASWVALNWTSPGGVGDLRVTAMPLGRARRAVEVTYPANTRSHTSPMSDAHLEPSEIDFTALRLHVPYELNRDFRVLLTARWEENGRERSRKFIVQVPVVRHSGADLEQVTAQLEPMSPGTSGWVEVAYAGFAPRLQDVRVVVTDPAGSEITYPGYGESTSLHHDATLVSGETDVVRFRVDTGGLEPGVHELELEVRYSKNGETRRLPGAVRLPVEG